MSCRRHSVVYAHRSNARQRDTRRQCPAYAAVHPFQFLYGRLCLFGRGYMRQILRSRPTPGAETGMPTADIDISHTRPDIHCRLCHTRHCPARNTLRRSVHTGSRTRIRGLGNIYTIGRIHGVCLRRNIHRPYSHAVDAPVHAVRHRRIFHSIYACVADNAQSRPVAGFSMLSGRARTIARTAALAKGSRGEVA